MKKTTSRTRRHERIREHILMAARELVLEMGVEHFSLRKLAERAHFSPASMYEYFDSKEALLHALATRAIAQLHARMARVPNSLRASTRLARFASCYLSFAREYPEDFLLAFLLLPSKRTCHHQNVEGSPYARLLEAAHDGLADGSFAPEEAETIAYGAWALVHGLATLQTTHLKHYDADFETADKKIIATWLCGLRPRKKN
jgi:AcrR family transcriptional regulator